MQGKKPVGGVRLIRSTPSKKSPEPVKQEEQIPLYTPNPYSLPDFPERGISAVSNVPLPLTPTEMFEVSTDFPYSTRPLGMTIIGQTGMGKTTLLEHLIRRDMENGITCVILDAHGDLTQSILAYASTLVPERTIVLQVDPEYPFGLNLYECPDYHSIVAIDRTIDTVVQLFKKQWGEDRQFFPRIEYVIKNTARTILANPQYTMLEIPLLFRDERFRQHCIANVKNSEVLQFWADYEGRSPYLKNELTESSILRIAQFLQSEFIQRVVSQAHTTIPFAEVFSKSGQLLLINLPIGKLGEGVTGFLGGIFLSVLTNMIYEREKLPMDQRVRVHIYLDEYGRFASATTAALLREGRKFNIGTTVAFQTLSDLQDQENRSAVMQTGSTVVFQVIGEDAAILAPEFADEPQEAWEEVIVDEWEEELKKEWVEVVTPQRHERVEEQVAIEVEEDVRAIPSDPVDYLLGMRGSHENKKIRELIQTYLTLLNIRTRVSIKDKKELVNQLLVAIMEGDIKTGTPLFADKIDEIIRSSYSKDWEDILSPHMWILIDKHDFIRRLTLENTRRVEHDFIQMFLALGWLEPEIVVQELKKLVNQVIDIISLCQELAKEPILVPTGQKRLVKRIQPHITYLTHEAEKINHPRIAITHPRKTISHPQRTYADMVNEKAMELASLPRFTCMIQSIDEEGKIQKRVVELPPPVQILPSRRGVDQIIANSQRYYRKWEDVEREIQERHYVPPPDKVGNQEDEVGKQVVNKRTSKLKGRSRAIQP